MAVLANHSLNPQRILKCNVYIYKHVNMYIIIREKKRERETDRVRQKERDVFQNTDRIKNDNLNYILTSTG